MTLLQPDRRPSTPIRARLAGFQILAAFLTSIFWSTAVLKAFEDEPRWRILNQTARQAIAAGDPAQAREALLELKPLMPGNARLADNLAIAEAKLGHQEQALAGLRRLAAMGLVYELTGNPDFAALRNNPGFAPIALRMEQNRKSVSHDVAGVPLPERDLITEDLAYDAKTKRYFVSSVREAKIIESSGQESSSKDFARTDWSAFALAVDEKRRVLWATTAWIAQCARCNKADEGATALLAFDLDSGALKQRIESPVKGVLGDMTISRRGEIFVSEGLHGAVFRLRPGGKALERLDAAGEFPAPQTPALSVDEKTLYVPDYLRGIAAIDLGTRAVRWLEPADDVALNGIDGFYRYRDGFVAVQNGVTPKRILRFSLDLKQQQILESNSLGLGEPTHGRIVGDDFYFLANSGWDAFEDDGSKKADIGPIESSIRMLPLSKAIGR